MKLSTFSIIRTFFICVLKVDLKYSICKLWQFGIKCLIFVFGVINILTMHQYTLMICLLRKVSTSIIDYKVANLNGIFWDITYCNSVALILCRVLGNVCVCIYMTNSLQLRLSYISIKYRESPVLCFIMILKTYECKSWSLLL